VATADTKRKKNYAKVTYQRYDFTVRKDDPLLEAIEAYKATPSNSLASLIKSLLGRHFDYLQSPNAVDEQVGCTVDELYSRLKEKDKQLSDLRALLDTTASKHQSEVDRLQLENSLLAAGMETMQRELIAIPQREQQALVLLAEQTSAEREKARAEMLDRDADELDYIIDMLQSLLAKLSPWQLIARAHTQGKIEAYSEDVLAKRKRLENLLKSRNISIDAISVQDDQFTP
jgi:hypothetical protein